MFFRFALCHSQVNRLLYISIHIPRQRLVPKCFIMSRVCLRWDKSFRLPFLHIYSCMCWTGPFEFRWLKEYIHNPSYYHHQIGNIHISHCCHIFPWLCVWDGCTIIFCHLLHIYIWTTTMIVSLYGYIRVLNICFCVMIQPDLSWNWQNWYVFVLV